MGDSVDNVPGVPGIGPKTAAKLIQEYGDVESGARRRAGDEAVKLRDNLIEHADKARLSRELVELICDSPLPEPLDDAGDQGHSRGAAARVPRASRLPARCSRGSARTRRAAAPAPSRPTQARGPARAEDRPLALRDGDRRGRARPLDRRGRRATAWSRSTPRPTGATASRAKLVGISLATDCNKACYIPLEHGGDDMFAERPDQLAADAGAGEAEAAARGSGDPQDRPQSQIRLGRARPRAASTSRPMTTRW